MRGKWFRNDFSNKKQKLQNKLEQHRSNQIFGQKYKNNLTKLVLYVTAVDSERRCYLANVIAIAKAIAN